MAVRGIHPSLIRAAIATIMQVALVSHVFAEPITGNDVHGACNNQEASVAQGFCIGYVLGAVEGMKWGALISIASMSRKERALDEMDLMSSAALGFCIPQEVQNGQILDVVKLHLDAVPAQRHESARTLIMEALSEAFPCP
ncbi:Rap1a/Tai family immunity protein [Seohaeicola nanhaiensis]|uniref:Rap1a/Tai family immunity protein n=1 Tax=Seohaeicola nanhaiensis TaxID=1387282 RepID=A0ABV9KCH9_9RHOB